MYKLHKYLIQYNFFISLCAVALIKYFSVLSGQAVPGYIYALTFFATLCTYNLFRIYPTFRSFAQGIRSFPFELIVYSLLLCMVCYCLLPWQQEVFYLLPAVLALAYKFPVFGRTNLRSTAFLKVFIIALVWVLAGAGALLYQRPAMAELRYLWPIILGQFLFFIAITLPFDVFDADRDHFKTFPTVFGAKISMTISIVCLMAYAVISISCVDTFPEKIAHGLVALTAYTVLLFYKKMARKIQRYYFVDGLILYQTFIIWLFH